MSVIGNVITPGGVSGGSESWEKLVDATSSADAVSWSFSQGDSGQTFDDYNSIAVLFLMLPNSGASEAVIALSFDNSNAWGYPDVVFSQGVKSAGQSRFSYARFERREFGIVLVEYRTSLNSGTAIKTTMVTGTNNAGAQNVNLTNSSDNTDANLTNVFKHNFNRIVIGTYVSAIGAGSKVQVWGRK